jgi:hypothetical protein
LLVVWHAQSQSSAYCAGGVGWFFAIFDSFIQLVNDIFFSFSQTSKTVHVASLIEQAFADEVVDMQCESQTYVEH